MNRIMLFYWLKYDIIKLDRNIINFKYNEKKSI